MADAAFFVVEPSLLVAGQMAAVATGEVALLKADHVHVVAQATSLPGVQMALAPFGADRAVEVFDAMVHLDTARMLVLSGRLGRGGASDARGHSQASHGDEQVAEFHGGRSPLRC